MRKMLKNEIGITLIALVVTIVVLLILAGVSISMLTGENGIITQAQYAKEETRGGAVEEARDLWRIDKETDKLRNSDTAQTLDELLDDLVEDKLLSEEEKEEIKETGEITIGSRTIEFDLSKKIDIYPSVRVVSEYIDREIIYKHVIVYEVRVPLEIVTGVTDREVLEVQEKLSKISEGINISTEEKEETLNQIFTVIAKIQKLEMTLDEIINNLAKNYGITEKCETWEQLYNTMKNSNIEDNIAIGKSYDEFLYSIILEGLPAYDEFFKEVTGLGSQYFYKELSFQYTVIKPDGSKIVEDLKINPGEEYDGPWFAIEVLVEEYGEYKMTIKSLETDYEGSTNIEYTDNRYLVEWNEGIIMNYLYDTQLKEVIEVYNAEEIYLYYNGEKIDLKNETINLHDIITPYEIEFIKNGEKIKIPVLIQRFVG